jgi:hypothetical protein
VRLVAIKILPEIVQDTGIAGLLPRKLHEEKYYGIAGVRSGIRLFKPSEFI